MREAWSLPSQPFHRVRVLPVFLGGVAGYRRTHVVSFKDAVELVAKGMDAVGVAVIVGGIVVATVILLADLRVRDRTRDPYRQYRHGIGRAILLGLEFLVAADIIRTIAVAPTFRGVGVLAIIVLIRTFLSMTLEVEIEGRWPWQKRRRLAAADGDSSRST